MDEAATWGAWDEAAAAALVGRRVLLAIEVADADGHVVRETRYWGRVAAADEQAGIDLALDDGGTFSLPPDLGRFRAVPPGEYHGDVRGEFLERPDVRATWRVAARR